MGLTERPLRIEDAQAVFEVMVAQEEADLDEVMIELADKFAGLQDGSAKTAIAMALFGKSGAPHRACSPARPSRD